MLRRALAFLLVFASLQGAVSFAVPAAWRQWLVEQGIVAMLARLVQYLSPALPLSAAGPLLWEPHGGLRIVAPCDGTTLLVLTVAALLVAPIPRRSRLLGILLAVPVVHVLNCARLLALFYAQHLDPAYFAPMHSLVTPLLLLLALAGLGRFWCRPVPAPHDARTPPA